jgi:hypothetical protein
LFLSVLKANFGKYQLLERTWSCKAGNKHGKYTEKATNNTQLEILPIMNMPKVQKSISCEAVISWSSSMI